MRPSRSASRTIRSASGRVTAGSLSAADRLRQHLERADRRLELVAHVGDEIAAHALDPVELRHVVDEHRRPDDRSPSSRSGSACSCERRPWRAEQPELALPRRALRALPRAASRCCRPPRHRRAALRGTAPPPDCGRPRCRRRRRRRRRRGTRRAPSPSGRAPTRCSPSSRARPRARARARRPSVVHAAAGSWHDPQPNRPVM